MLLRKPIGKKYLKLRMNLPPVLALSRPFFRNVYHCKIKHLQKAVICRKYAFAFCNFAKLSLGRLVLVFQPPIISGFADFQDFAHQFYCVSIFVFQNKYMPFSCFYLFRSFAKKPRVSFNISFARRSSAFSRSSSHILA